MTRYRISQLAERCGVPATTLRFYESAGLLPAERTAAGYRVYGEDAVRRLAFIASAKRLGLGLEEIRELLQIWPDGACSAVRARLLPLVQARMNQAHGRIAELTAFSSRLGEVHEQLSGPAPAGACGPGCGCVPLSDEAARSQPVACSLDGPSMSERARDWRRLLASSSGRESIPNGLRLTFPAEPVLALEVTRLAVAEQECCPFFDITLHLTAAALELSVRTPEAGAGLLADLFGATA